MGQTLTVADEKQAYTISDKATFLAHEDSLSMLLEETDDMKNTYSMIVVTAERLLTAMSRARRLLSIGSPLTKPDR